MEKKNCSLFLLRPRYSYLILDVGPQLDGDYRGIVSSDSTNPSVPVLLFEGELQQRTFSVDS